MADNRKQVNMQSRPQQDDTDKYFTVEVKTEPGEPGEPVGVSAPTKKNDIGEGLSNLRIMQQHPTRRVKNIRLRQKARISTSGVPSVLILRQKTMQDQVKQMTQSELKTQAVQQSQYWNGLRLVIERKVMINKESITDIAIINSATAEEVSTYNKISMPKITAVYSEVAKEDNEVISISDSEDTKTPSQNTVAQDTPAIAATASSMETKKEKLNKAAEEDNEVMAISDSEDETPSQNTVAQDPSVIVATGSLMENKREKLNEVIAPTGSVLFGEKLLSVNDEKNVSSRTMADCDIFGQFVAGELIQIRCEQRRRQLKRTIQKAIIAVGEEIDNL